MRSGNFVELWRVIGGYYCILDKVSEIARLNEARESLKNACRMSQRIHTLDDETSFAQCVRNLIVIILFTGMKPRK